MSEKVGVMIGQSLSLCVGYAERLLKDVTPETFTRFATVGGVEVNSNHPAFVLGHLSIYAPKMVTHLGGDASALAIPEEYQAVFSPAATCQDDPDGIIYPSMEIITARFFDGYKAVLENLQAADDAVFQTPNPNEGRMRELFPSLGAMHMFYVSGHMMMHLGQMSAWRRMQGLGAA